MDIIAAYREAGTFRGAAGITGTTHKTVRRTGGNPAVFSSLSPLAVPLLLKPRLKLGVPGSQLRHRHLQLPVPGSQLLLQHRDPGMQGRQLPRRRDMWRTGHKPP